MMSRYLQIKSEIASRLEQVLQRVRQACIETGRSPDEITLIAVSKKKSAEEIRAALELGIENFGENYVQEWKKKREQLESFSNIKWHFIGHLQKNKCKYLAGKVALIHSIDSIELLDELQKRIEKIESHPVSDNASPPRQSVLLQVKLAEEETKGGFVDTSEVKEVLELYLSGRWSNLDIRGLMGIPPLRAVGERARPYFQKLAELREALRGEFSIELPDLSMGMSSDLEFAIAEGATYIRVGTAIFGPRA